MVAEVYAGLGAVKAAFDLARGLKDINDATVRNAAIIELQRKILAVQQEQSGLLDRTRELEHQIESLEAWESEKQRYDLRELPPGVFVYELKPSDATGEPPHKICQTCFQRRKKSILQADAPVNGIYRLNCFECGTQLRAGHFQAPMRNRAPSPWVV
jgi:hypothetical protein